MAITRNDIISLIKTTMQDCPLPPVADILEAIGPDDSEAKPMFDFIKSHYTKEQICDGIDEYLKHVESMQRLFG